MSIMAVIFHFINHSNLENRHIPNISVKSKYKRNWSRSCVWVVNGIAYVFYHNSYLKYYLFLIILIRIQRNSIDLLSLHLLPFKSQTWETATASEPNGYVSGYFGPPEERSVIDPGAPANLFNCPIKCLWKVWVSSYLIQPSWFWSKWPHDGSKLASR